MERQRRIPEPFAHRVKETACVAFTLEADDQIVRVTNDDHVALSLPPSPALGPKIEAVMQVDVGKERRNHRTLSRSPVIDRHDPIFEARRRRVHPPFLLHVLPSGFHRIRHYGLIAGAVRARDIERVHQLLTAATQPRESERAEADNETETPPTARRCPCCGGRMIELDPGFRTIG